MNVRKTIENLSKDNFYADTSAYVSKLNEDSKLEFISNDLSIWLFLMIMRGRNVKKSSSVVMKTHGIFFWSPKLETCF